VTVGFGLIFFGILVWLGLICVAVWDIAYTLEKMYELYKVRGR